MEKKLKHTQILFQIVEIKIQTQEFNFGAENCCLLIIEFPLRPKINKKLVWKTAYKIIYIISNNFYENDLSIIWIEFASKWNQQK